MTRPFISQVFTDTGGDYDLLILTDGDVIVPVRLTPGAAHVQTGQMAFHERVVDDDCVGETVQRAIDHVDGTWAKEGQVHVV